MLLGTIVVILVSTMPAFGIVIRNLAEQVRVVLGQQVYQIIYPPVTIGGMIGQQLTIADLVFQDTMCQVEQNGRRHGLRLALM